MILTAENYFSKEASLEYISVSQYKDFYGCYGYRGCEAKAMAQMRGEWTREVTNSMLIGSYVDAHFEGTLGVFCAQHPEILKKDGSLKAEFEHANTIIARCERDEYFMKVMSGQKQVIMTASLFGHPWKIKMDSYLPGMIIGDLKVMKSLRERLWVRDLKNISFCTYWGYDIQGAVYQAIVEAVTGEKLPFLVAAASKETSPDIQVLGFTDPELADALALVKGNVDRIVRIKDGEIEPDRCEQCDYCRATKVLTGPIHHNALIFGID